MRSWPVIVIALTACGRLGFEPGDDGSDTGDDPTAMRRLCMFTRYTQIENGITDDDSVGVQLASSLSAACGVVPSSRAVSQDDAGVLDPTTSRPLIPADELVVIGGGDGPNRALGYLLESDTSITWFGTSPATYRERATGRTIVMGPTSSSHDYAVLMVVAESVGGGRILSASGMSTNGTVAAGYWFANQIAPVIQTSSYAWIIVEWTNADADPRPSAGDTFAIVASGV